jgi:hypothetical protein
VSGYLQKLTGFVQALIKAAFLVLGVALVWVYYRDGAQVAARYFLAGFLSLLLLAWLLSLVVEGVRRFLKLFTSTQ